MMPLCFRSECAEVRGPCFFTPLCWSCVGLAELDWRSEMVDPEQPAKISSYNCSFKRMFMSTGSDITNSGIDPVCGDHYF